MAAQMEGKSSEVVSVSTFNISIGSSSPGGIKEGEDEIVGLSDEQLQQLTEETLRSNHVLALETDIFERASKKLEATVKHLPRLARSSSSNFPPTSGDSSQATLSGTTRRRVRLRGSSIGDRLSRRLTPEQKCELVQREIERYKAEITKINESTERTMSHLRASIKEAATRSLEMSREAYEFNRDIAKGAYNPVTGRINPDKAAKFWQERILGMESLNLKLRLKNAALKVRRKRLKQVLRQQEETGDVLQEVDFSQMTIENLQYAEKIEERSQDLINLKLMTASVLRILNNYRQKLKGKLSESRRLKLDIASRQELIHRLDNETAIVEDERLEAEQINRKLQKQVKTFRVPATSDYVECKAEAYDLKKKLQLWKRKVEVTSMALQTKRCAWRKVSTTALEKHKDHKAVVA